MNLNPRTTHSSINIQPTIVKINIPSVNCNLPNRLRWRSYALITYYLRSSDLSIDFGDYAGHGNDNNMKVKEDPIDH